MCFAMEKKLKIVGHFKDALLLTVDGENMKLDKTFTLKIKDKDLVLEIILMPLPNGSTMQQYIGSYSIETKL